MDIDLSYLDPSRFESLASDLLMEEAESVRTIDGSGGDDGIDCFKGQTQGSITIFQHKFFTGRLNHSRESQIQSSYETAKENHPGLERWCLLIALDFTPKEQQWFEKTIEQDAENIEVDIWNESKIENLVSEYDHIVDRYFQQSTLAAGRKANEAIEFLSGNPLEQVAGAGEKMTEIRSDHSHWGIEYHYDSQEETHQVKADPEFPIELETSFDIGEEKLKKLEAGEKVELSPEEVEKLEASPSAVIPDDAELSSLVIKPSYQDIEKEVQLEAPSIGFRRKLTLEVSDISDNSISLSTTDTGLDLSFTYFEDSSEGTFDYNVDFEGQPVHEVYESLDLLKSLINADDFLMRDLEDDKIVFRAESDLDTLPDELSLLDEFVTNLYIIESKTGTSFTFDDWDELDFENARIARDLLEGKETKSTIETFSAELEPGFDQTLVDEIDGDGVIEGASINFGGFEILVLSQYIEVGDVELEIPKAKIKNIDQVEEAADTGSSVSLEMVPIEQPPKMKAI
ncbi:hypothetical protein GCM10009067_34820 [Haloarcula sebkhae]|uniref:Restriction endonuclease type IV Mrr domain-containing protein n=2 Tax=Haloarcula sebkhae TaxID=932660 RepID=A0A830EVR7_9EURY|nr:hypothetical protein GCM10009067_34820 [Haloarcula sebkhae]